MMKSNPHKLIIIGIGLFFFLNPLFSQSFKIGATAGLPYATGLKLSFFKEVNIIQQIVPGQLIEAVFKDYLTEDFNSDRFYVGFTTFELIDSRGQSKFGITEGPNHSGIGFGFPAFIKDTYVKFWVYAVAGRTINFSKNLGIDLSLLYGLYRYEVSEEEKDWGGVGINISGVFLPVPSVSFFVRFPYRQNK